MAVKRHFNLLDTLLWVNSINLGTYTAKYNINVFEIRNLIIDFQLIPGLS